MNLEFRLKESAYLLAQLRSQFENMTFEMLCTEYKKENPQCSIVELTIFLKRINPSLGLKDLQDIVEKYIN